MGPNRQQHAPHIYRRPSPKAEQVVILISPGTTESPIKWNNTTHIKQRTQSSIYKMGRITKIYAAILYLVAVHPIIYILMTGGAVLSSHSLKMTDNEQPLSQKNINITNEFVSTFAQLISSAKKTGADVPLILKNGQLLCLSNHKHQLQQMRVRVFLEMVSRGLKLDYFHSSLANPVVLVVLVVLVVFVVLVLRRFCRSCRSRCSRRSRLSRLSRRSRGFERTGGHPPHFRPDFRSFL